MKRVVIIGSGGAGKSTFARRLHEATALPLIHLDAVFWRPNWTETPKDEWRKKVEELIKSDAWIMDGNFGGTMETRIAAADTAIFLDLPRALCTYRALKRAARYRRRTRPDMGAGCPEKFDLEFLSWIWNFSKNTKPRIENLLEKFNHEKRIIHLKSRGEVENFFVELAANKVKSS